MKIVLDLKLLAICLLSVSLLWGCTAAVKKTGDEAPAGGSAMGIADISKGLPQEGQWRQHIALADVNGDGFLDIVAPPPRKAQENVKRPFIFVWNAKEGKWEEGRYVLPKLKDYDYGGVAVGDLNKDGHIDIVLATHSGRIILLMNDTRGGFAEAPFPLKEEFHSRAVVVSDMNGDGWPDIVSLSEAAFSRDYAPKGILIGVNNEGKNWDVSILKESTALFGDSLATGNIDGGGNRDITITTLTNRKDMKKTIWLSDGKGGFRAYVPEQFGDVVPFSVRTGDLDGDGRDEAVFLISGIGLEGKITLSALKWSAEGFKDLPPVPVKDRPVAFDLADIDEDGRTELAVLGINGIYIYKYGDRGWAELKHHSLSPAEADSAHDLRMGKNRDGSWVIAYNLGSENPAGGHGIKAFLLK